MTHKCCPGRGCGNCNYCFGDCDECNGLNNLDNEECGYFPCGVCDKCKREKRENRQMRMDNLEKEKDGYALIIMNKEEEYTVKFYRNINPLIKYVKWDYNVDITEDDEMLNKTVIMYTDDCVRLRIVKIKYEN